MTHKVKFIKDYESIMVLWLEKYASGTITEKENLLENIFKPMARLIDKIESEENTDV